MTGTSTGRADARPSIGELVSALTEKLSLLIRSEIQLAKAELSEKAKHSATGIGLFAGAAFLGFFAFAVLITTIILGIAEALPAWLAALIVFVVLAIGAAILALAGRKEVQQGMPPGPERAQQNLKLDVQAVKEGLQS